MTLVRPNNPPSPGRGPKRSRSRKPAKKGGGSIFCVVLQLAMAAVPVAVSVITL